MKKLFAAATAVFMLLCCGCGGKETPKTEIMILAECDGAALAPAEYAAEVLLDGKEQPLSEKENGYCIEDAASGKITGTVMYQERVQVSFGFEYDGLPLEDAQLKISLSHGDGVLRAEQTFTARQNGQPIERRNSAETADSESILSVSEIKE